MIRRHSARLLRVRRLARQHPADHPRPPDRVPGHRGSLVHRPQPRRAPCRAHDDRPTQWVRGRGRRARAAVARSLLQAYPGYDDLPAPDRAARSPSWFSRPRAVGGSPPDAAAAGQDADEEDAQHPGVRHGRLAGDAEHAAVLPRAADRRPLRGPAQEADRARRAPAVRRAARGSGAARHGLQGLPRRGPRATCPWTRPASWAASSPTRG